MIRDIELWKKILLILIFINILNSSNASTIDFSSLERQLKIYNHCSGIEEELKIRLEEFISEKDFYEFDNNEKKKKYKFFIPKRNIIKYSEDKSYLTFYNKVNKSLLEKKEVFLNWIQIIWNYFCILLI